MKSALILAALALLVITPAQASKLDDLKAVFENHCTTHGLSLSCSVSHEHKLVTDLPDTIIPAGPTTSHGPGTSACGFEQVAIDMPGNHPDFCVADYTSWMFKNANPAQTIDNGTVTTFTCTTKTGTISLIPLKLTGSEVTAPGRC